MSKHNIYILIRPPGPVPEQHYTALGLACAQTTISTTAISRWYGQLAKGAKINRCVFPVDLGLVLMPLIEVTSLGMTPQ